MTEPVKEVVSEKLDNLPSTMESLDLSQQKASSNNNMSVKNGGSDSATTTAVEKSENNPKYDKLPGEFFDKEHNVLWNVWTTPEILTDVQEFEFTEEDVILATYLKSGTTLVQEILWLIYNDCDTEKADKTPVYVRVPFLELHVNYEDGFEKRNHIQVLKETKSPRLIKTHVPLRYIKREVTKKNPPKVIHVIRNPKDTMTSYYHFHKGVEDYGPWRGDWNEFYKMWMDGWLVAGDWLDVTLEWWARRDEPNHLYIFFEDVLRYPAREIKRIANFVGKPLTDDKLQIIMERTKFDKMRANPATNYSTMPGVNFQFMRKGQIGDWKNHFTVAQNEHFNHHVIPKLLAAGLHFQYE